MLSWLLSFEERETLQYASHLYCSTPPICTAVRPPFVRQYFRKNTGGWGHRNVSDCLFSKVLRACKVRNPWCFGGFPWYFRKDQRKEGRWRAKEEPQSQKSTRIAPKNFLNNSRALPNRTRDAAFLLTVGSFLLIVWQHFLGPGPGLQIPETGLWDDPRQRVCLRSALLSKEVLGAGLSQGCALSVTDPSQKAVSEPFVRQVQVPIFAVIVLAYLLTVEAFCLQLKLFYLQF